MVYGRTDVGNIELTGCLEFQSKRVRNYSLSSEMELEVRALPQLWEGKQVRVNGRIIRETVWYSERDIEELKKLSQRAQMPGFPHSPGAVTNYFIRVSDVTLLSPLSPSDKLEMERAGSVPAGGAGSGGPGGR